MIYGSALKLKSKRRPYVTPASTPMKRPEYNAKTYPVAKMSAYSRWTALFLTNIFEFFHSK